jgi:polyhydroxybutyrate depolymerase
MQFYEAFLYKKSEKGGGKMTLKKYCIIALLAIMAMLLPAGAPIALAQESPPELSSGPHTGWMTENYTAWDNSTWSCNRTFEYYIPTSFTNSTEVPLLFSFHGLGSTGDQQRDLSRFDLLAEQEGFIAVFPNATNLTREGNPCNATLPDLPGAEIQWNLGGGSLQYCAGVDDVGFVSDMIDWFETNYAINASRIYSTGMSDGALFSYLLAFNLTGKFAGIAPVCGPMPWGFDTPATAPITVILMMGTADPILAYDGHGGLGGDVTYSTDETIQYWCGVDGINYTSPAPAETVWGPTTTDLTVVHRYVWSGGTNGTQVILFKIVGGGHTWPGGVLYSLVVGAVTHHIDGSAYIWKHLPPTKYCLAVRSGDGGSVPTPTAFANVNSDGKYMFFYPGTGSHVVNLAATPSSSNYRFYNWTGDVSTIGNSTAATTTITINPDVDHKDYEIKANFIAQYDLTISSTDGGSVTIPGEGIHTYDPGTVVNLVATSDSGYSFVNWTGTGTVTNSTSPSTTITMNGDYSLMANFAPSGGGGCFIATAAYGTPTAKQLDVLRAFRDEVLLKSTVGSRLVDFYYKVSPPIANFISQHNVVRTLVRELMVDPIVWLLKVTGGIWRN